MTDTTPTHSADERDGDFAFLRAIAECAAERGPIQINPNTGKSMVTVIDRLSQPTDRADTAGLADELRKRIERYGAIPPYATDSEKVRERACDLANFVDDNSNAILTALRQAPAPADGVNWKRPCESDEPARKDIARDPTAPAELFGAVGMALFRADCAGMNAPDSIAEIGNAAWTALSSPAPEAVEMLTKGFKAGWDALLVANGERPANEPPVEYRAHLDTFLSRQPKVEAENAALRDMLQTVRVLICEATEPRTRHELLKDAVALIDALTKDQGNG